MLKYQVNTNEFKSDFIPINCIDIEYSEMTVIDEETRNVVYDGSYGKDVVTCYHDGAISIKKGDTVISSYEMEDSDGIPQTYQQKNIVTGANIDEKHFTFVSDRYITLDTNKFSYGKTSDYDEVSDSYTEGHYVYLYMNSFHFWGDDEYPLGVNVYFLDTSAEEESIVLVGEPFGDKCVRLPLDESIVPQIDCEDMEEDECRETTDNIANEIGLYNLYVMNNRRVAKTMFEYYGLVDSDSDWSDILNELFSDNVLSEEYSVMPFSFMRDNFLFKDTSDNISRTIGILKPNVSITIPLTSRIGTDLNQETNVHDKFVDVKIKEAINPYVEMEKDVYMPVFKQNGTFSNVKEIRFNLHFRERDGEDWKVKRDGYWNGTKVNDSGKYELMNDSKEDAYGFFSYTYDKSSQSDLLSYLNFTDSDVKYRKNTLKKSFLRLSFFDSMKPTNQNLLCYSTVFTDTGLLFSKYMRNFENPKVPSDDFAFSRIVGEDGEMKMGLSGSRVNREPYWSVYPTNVDEIEKLRLSSQFVVKDKYSSDSCSEGFYLYLWRDYANGNTPVDIYMRVEFNHAGFGRTIPFMMPYDKVDNSVKDFQTIVTDFNNGNGYGVKEYLRYSYVRFKYLTTDDNRNIYYLDYDDGLNFKDGVLTLNLYEAKLID